jgi:protein disulfide-isomerase A6
MDIRKPPTYICCPLIHCQIVEFYAPWCGHCQNLKPAYEKAAKALAGLAKVAAIDCDDEANKPLCGQMGVTGFPTLKIVKPGTKPGRPVVEDYSGARSAKAIVDAVKDKIPNHVKRLQGPTFDTWFNEESNTAKAVVFSEKGTTSPLVKSLAVDFLGSITFAQVKDATTAKKYGISEFPTVLLIPAQGGDPVPYKGDLSRDSLLSFFAQVASPNPDPALPKAKAPKSSKKPKATSSASAKFSRASEAHKSSDFDDFMGSSGTIVLDDDTPTESPIPIVNDQQEPIAIPSILPPIPTVSTSAELEALCLAPKSANCILVLLPTKHNSDSISEAETSVLSGFAEIVDKHKKRQANLIPMFAIPAEVAAATRIRQDLDISPPERLEVVALNMKRGWWRHYASQTFEVLELEDFVDAIKLGEGTKQKLPSNFGGSSEDESKPDAKDDFSIVGDETSESEATDILSEVQPQKTAASRHEEL